VDFYNSFKRFHRLQEGLVGYVHDVLKSSKETKFIHRLRAGENEKFLENLVAENVETSFIVWIAWKG
jgi:hypothetical protein